MQQDYDVVSVRAAAVLTTGYVAGSVISYQNANPALRNQLNLLVAFTKGSLTTAEVKVEFSLDGSTWFQDTFETITAGTAAMSLGEYQFSATGNYVINIPSKWAYVRVSAKGTGTVDDSSMKIDAVMGTV